MDELKNLGLELRDRILAATQGALRRALDEIDVNIDRNFGDWMGDKDKGPSANAVS